jgi:hypothetical protein
VPAKVTKVCRVQKAVQTSQKCVWFRKQFICHQGVYGH